MLCGHADNSVLPFLGALHPCIVDVLHFQRFSIQKSPPACCDPVWALSIDMQKHNEDKFMEAYRSASSVFLVFSVNMSGHFQGYAKISSLPFKHQQVGILRVLHSPELCLDSGN